MAQHNDLGKHGEEMAVNHLLQNGYEIVARNYRFQKAEIDIIAKKEEVLAVVEVKTRSSLDFGGPQEFVKKRKIQLLVQAIDNFVLEKEMDLDVRFDIIAIYNGKTGTTVEHFEDAFYYF